MGYLDEYAALPEEFPRPPAEWTPPAGERLFSSEAMSAEPDNAPGPSTPRKHTLRRQLKAYAVTAVAAVTVAATMLSTPVPDGEWDFGRIDRDLSEYHFAYYAQSPDEIETYLENEMWYRYFGKLGDHEAPYYGLFGLNPDEPSQSFRDALKLSDSLRQDSSVPGLPAYQYELLLWGKPSQSGSIRSDGEVILLESPEQVLISYRENGEERFGFFEAHSSGQPLGEQSYHCSFDITTRENGEMEADIRVYGNGVDIVGTFEESLEPGSEQYKLVHATNEHSNNACQNNLSYVIRIVRDVP